jgi:mannose-6-phosphate isomerase-like protein (cupin superfamily)
MTVKRNRAEVEPEEHPYAMVWRFVRRDGPEGVGVGITAFRHDADAARAAMEAHDVPEVHYVMSGEGILLEEDRHVLLREGDAVVTMPAVRHALWATSTEPLVTLYVAMYSVARPGPGEGPPADN